MAVEWVQRCTETNVMKDAIRNGNLDNVKWIWNQNSNWDDYEDVNIFFSLAAKKGHFEILKWLHEQNCPEGSRTISPINLSQMNAFSMAAEYGSSEIMKWLKEKSYEWDQWILPSAAINGNFKNIKWLKDVGCTVE